MLRFCDIQEGDTIAKHRLPALTNSRKEIIAHLNAGKYVHVAFGHVRLTKERRQHRFTECNMLRTFAPQTGGACSRLEWQLDFYEQSHGPWFNVTIPMSGGLKFPSSTTWTWSWIGQKVSRNRFFELQATCIAEIADALTCTRSLADIVYCYIFPTEFDLSLN